MWSPVQIHIPRPCHENWENMTAWEKGRFCGACQTTVVDLSKMTDKEILDTISNAGKHLCGRFAGSQNQLAESGNNDVGGINSDGVNRGRRKE